MRSPASEQARRQVAVEAGPLTRPSWLGKNHHMLRSGLAGRREPGELADD